MMSRTIDTAREIYVTGLRNQHAIENQAIELLERQIGRLENYPEMADRMRQHLEESKQQAARIEELLAGFEYEPLDLEGHGDLVHGQRGGAGPCACI